ncbi:hypothetical protein [Methylobacterium brachythecii]|uniref:Uncharacterized protein n=1 Tax=Methylobacterium brachythecii TaxID=1176177 RepID=A0A7W6ANA8_9HYPH|nr:hypothetical protein [Methylobacterium brachythecii]MBB3903721.1 hypothetical protein [Methylobacterium brachythecii]GLS44290.1 hypothetical protein GCM10007884_22780 [Methylobacterium brachythecii]
MVMNSAIRRLFAAALALALVSLPSSARAGCVWSDLAGDETWVSVVSPEAGKTHFIKDAVFVKGCPGNRPECQDRAFLVPGDLVVTKLTKGEFACVGYVGPKGQTTIGWLPRPALTAAPEPEQAPKDWTGRWVTPAQEITIKAARSNLLIVTGKATWGDTPERRNTGSVHTGEIEGSMAPKDGVLAFTMGDDGRTLPHEAGGEYACRIRMIRRGPYLVARDNNGCGGANVSFSGLYRRAR